MCGITLSVVATSFSAITSDSIKDKQNQISKAEQEKNALKNTLSDIKKLKEGLEAEKKNLKNYISKLDAGLAEIQEKIAELETMILVKEAEVEEAQIQLDAAIEVELVQYEALKVRIQMMYEQGDMYFWDVILSGDGFADYLSNIDYMEQIAAYDQKKLSEYILNRELVETCKAGLDAEREVLSEAKAAVEAEKQNLEELIAEKKVQIQKYEKDIKNKSNEIEEYLAEIEAQDQMIAALETAIAEDRKKILAENGLVLTYDGGAFKFPLASYTRVSDDYGMRIHPTLKVEQFHNGVDFASPSGTAIYAAYDGIVVAATYSTTMGNYIMIDHGDGLYTIYMHASALYVKKDDVVARGNKIAAVGSTGRSTGPHLHFSVRKNGEYTSPWNYISK